MPAFNEDPEVAAISTFVTNGNCDFTIRCGSLAPDQPDTDRLWVGEIDTQSGTHSAGPNDTGAGYPTLGEVLDDFATWVGQQGGN